MKRLLAYLFIVLGFGLTFNVSADDIRDFEIEGMSIGDSLLSYFSKELIDKKIYTPWKNKKIYYQFSNRKNLTQYDSITVAILINDNNYKIYELTGRIKMDYKKCKIKLKEVSLEIESVFASASKRDRGEYNHQSDKSKKSKVTSVNYLLNDGSIVHLGCYDWSDKITKKKGWTDDLSIALGSKQFYEWQKNKAFK